MPRRALTGAFFVTAAFGSDSAGSPLAAPPTMPGRDGLHVAARDGDANGMERLLQGVDAAAIVDQHGYFGPEWRVPGAAAPPESPEDIFAQAMLVGGKEGAAMIQQMMMREFDKSVRNGGAPLHHAAWNGHLAVAQLLLGKGAAVGSLAADSKTPLHLAALAGHKTVTDLLISHGAFVDALDAFGGRPLHGATSAGHVDVTIALLERGVAVSADTDPPGSTALYSASLSGHLDVANLLLHNGAQANASDANGWTALHAAAAAGHFEMARLLISQGADVTAEDKHGVTASAVAASQGHEELAAFIEPPLRREAATPAEMQLNAWIVKRGLQPVKYTPVLIALGVQAVADLEHLRGLSLEDLFGGVDGVSKVEQAAIFRALHHSEKDEL